MIFSEFPENIEKTYLKENLLMDVPYFVKEHPWMSAFAEATLKNILVEITLPKVVLENKMVP